MKQPGFPDDHGPYWEEDNCCWPTMSLYLWRSLDETSPFAGCAFSWTTRIRSSGRWTLMCYYSNCSVTTEVRLWFGYVDTLCDTDMTEHRNNYCAAIKNSYGKLDHHMIKWPETNHAKVRHQIKITFRTWDSEFRTAIYRESLRSLMMHMMTEGNDKNPGMWLFDCWSQHLLRADECHLCLFSLSHQPSTTL